jgi:hypothetical protein
MRAWGCALTQQWHDRHSSASIPSKSAVAESTWREEAQAPDATLEALRFTRVVIVSESEAVAEPLADAVSDHLASEEDADFDRPASTDVDEATDQDVASDDIQAEEPDEHDEDSSLVAGNAAKCTSAVAASTLSDSLSTAPWRSPSAASFRTLLGVQSSRSHRRRRRPLAIRLHSRERDCPDGSRSHRRIRSREKVRLRSRSRGAECQFLQSESYNDLVPSVKRAAIGPSGLPQETETEPAHERAHVRLRAMLDARARETGTTELPAWVGEGNFMIATWTVGAKARWKDLEDKLTFSPFAVIVIILLPAVADEVLKGIESAARSSSNITSRAPLKRPSKGQPQVDKLVQEKSLILISPNAYVSVHRAKVSSVENTLFGIRSHGDGIRSHGEEHLSQSSGVHLSKVMVTLDCSRQRMSDISIGVLVVDDQYPVLQSHVDAIVNWIIKEQVAILTGYFGDNKEEVREIAVRTNAILDRPLAQLFWVHSAMPQSRSSGSRSRGQWDLACIPTYFLLYGYYRRVTIPRDVEVPCFAEWRGKCRGETPDDFEGRLIKWSDIPTWTNNDLGSAFVPHHGNVKMKPVNFERWCPNVHQTALWMGTATPSYKSQLRQAQAGKAKVRV